MIKFIEHEIAFAKFHLSALLDNPLKVPDQYTKDGLWEHYFICMMLTIGNIAFWSMTFESLPLVWNALVAIALSFVTVLTIAYLKELVYDKWIKGKFIDPNDIRFSMYGWASIALLLLPMALIRNILKR